MLYLCFLNKISYLQYHIYYIIFAISYPEKCYILYYISSNIYDIINEINSNNMISYMMLYKNSLVHVVVDTVRVKIFVVIHVLDEIFDILHIHHHQFLVIHQDVLALGESFNGGGKYPA
jgi:hypothetical protein